MKCAFYTNVARSTFALLVISSSATAELSPGAFYASGLVPLYGSPALRAARDHASFLPGPAQTGEVVITEFMKDPSTVLDTRGEWIEVYNALPWRVNLEGYTLSDDGGASHTLTNGGAGIRIRPGRYFVLGINGDPTLNGGVSVGYVYSGFSLGNGSDQIILSKPGGQVVDRVAYDDGVLWPDAAGKSIGLELVARDSLLNDDPLNWCHASTPISATNTDTGTPGVDNDICP